MWNKIIDQDFFTADDPEKMYSFVGKSQIGSGAFATVFNVKRKSDQQEFAMKVVKYAEKKLPASEKK